ncbi:hypothetical protein [Streptomyces phaeochromogenes]|nr:hypothetical protein OG478_49255 [Streptomyces phaeochromogenes]WTA09580.1 hypothetical protein OHB08_48805 [Streptomyces phaeochromogenes]
MAITKTEKVPAKKTATRKTTKKTAAKKAIRGAAQRIVLSQHEHAG